MRDKTRPSDAKTRPHQKNLDKVNETKPKHAKMSQLSKWDKTQKSKKSWLSILDETLKVPIRDPVSYGLV